MSIKTYILKNKTFSELGYFWNEWLEQLIKKRDCLILNTFEETINLIKKTNEPNELIVLGGIHNQENEILKREKINISTICSVKHRLSLKDQIINSTEIANNIIFTDFYPDEVDLSDLEFEIVKSFISKINDISTTINFNILKVNEESKYSLVIKEKDLSSMQSIIYNIANKIEDYILLDLSDNDFGSNFIKTIRNKSLNKVIFIGNDPNTLSILIRIFDNSSVTVYAMQDLLGETRKALHNIRSKSLHIILDLNKSLRSSIKRNILYNDTNSETKNDLNCLNNFISLKENQFNRIIKRSVLIKKTDSILINPYLKYDNFDFFVKHIANFESSIFPITLLPSSDSEIKIEDKLIYENIAKHACILLTQRVSNFDSQFILSKLLNRFPGCGNAALDEIVATCKSDNGKFLTSFIFQIQISLSTFAYDNDIKLITIKKINEVLVHISNEQDKIIIHLTNLLFLNNLEDFQSFLQSTDPKKIPSSAISRAILFKFREQMQRIRVSNNDLDILALQKQASHWLNFEQKSNLTGYYSDITKCLHALYSSTESNAHASIKDIKFLFPYHYPIVAEVLYHAVISESHFLVEHIFQILELLPSNKISKNSQLLLDVISVFNGNELSDSKSLKINPNNQVSPFINLFHLHFICSSNTHFKDITTTLESALKCQQNRDSYLFI